MITVYLGDVTEYLSHVAQAHDRNASLITDRDLDTISAGTYYTSVADMGGLYQLGTLLQKCQKIIYAPPPGGQWSGGAMMKKWTEDYLKIFSARTTVENFPIERLQLDNIAHRQTDSQQLWVAGCSISHGLGVQPGEKYGQLLANKLDTPVTFLTAPGSSVTWAADQILRADIKPKDIVVWGLTSHLRLPYYEKGKIFHVNARFYENNPEFSNKISPDSLLSQDSFYKALTSVYQVINFCKKTQASLLIASLLDNEIIHCLTDFADKIMLYNLWGREPQERYLDLGSDGEHPGPITHEFYANEIYQKLAVT